MLGRFALLLWALVAAPLAAQSSISLERTKVELIAESAHPAAGQTLVVGVVVTPKPGWHTYWQQPGDAGLPVTASWQLPAGATASAFRFPVPEPFMVSGLMNHVYSSRATLLADVAVPAGARGDFPLRAHLGWLVCDDRLCVPEEADLSLPLTIGDGAADPGRAADFAAAREALPRQLAADAHFEAENGRIRLSVPFAAPETVTGAHFFPLAADAVRFAAPQQVTRTGNSLLIDMEAESATAPSALAGVLRVERGREVLGLSLSASPGAVATGEPLRAAPGGASLLSALGPALGLALLGGLLLNLMPCVFPILSLKALSLARAGHSQALARAEGLAYAAGVVLVTTLLGGVAILLARAGAGAGWAFQLQDPRVILFLLLLTLAIGLNFAGLFEVNAGALNAGGALAARSGIAGAFFTGTLAAFVATPCTGPFMAGALGAALLLPPLAGLAVFFGLGLGLALPFLAVGFVPALRRRLPRPGPWMLHFRHILAVPMLLTALGLAWVLGRQTGVDGMTIGLLAALLLALPLWWLGQRQRHGRRGMAALWTALLVAGAAPWFAAPGGPPAAGPESSLEEALAARPYSAAALAQARAGAHPVFLYFTADWCLTCKVNERGAMASPAVAQSFRARGIEVLVGDWTRPDPAIARFLEQHGRAGIPLYLFYDSNGSVRELPQILTTNLLTAL